MPRIFISYRRADSEAITGRIHDRLLYAFGDANVFKDVNDIPPGRDFRGILQEAVNESDVILVIIGTQWLTVTDANGKRRIDDPDDFVHIEVRNALQRDRALTIPVLVNNATMPTKADLPPDLQQLAYKNAVRVRNDPDFKIDMDRLIKYLKPPLPIKSIIAVLLIFILLIIIGIVSRVVPVPFSTATLQAPTIETAISATSVSTSTGVSTNTPTEQTLCTVTAFQVTPSDSPQPIDTLLTLYGAGSCADGVRASRFSIDGDGFGEDASLTEQSEMWQLLEGTHTICFEITFGEWEAGASECMEITGQVDWTPTPTISTLGLSAEAPVINNVDWQSYVEQYVRTFSGIEMVLVPTGSLTIGVVLGTSRDSGGETVTFETPFWIGRYEVTNAQYGSAGRFSGNNHPRDSVTWIEARDFCAGLGLRLPTEAEWEYAAGGPDELIYPWGNVFSRRNAVFNSSVGTMDAGNIPAGVSWVGALDMSGNVAEWTSTIFRDYPYRSDTAHENPDEAAGTFRVLRGGSWFDSDEAILSTTNRASDYPTFDGNGLYGFRCARDYQPTDLETTTP